MIENPAFLMRANASQVALAPEPRTESNRTRCKLQRIAVSTIWIQYEDTGRGREVTPRFLEPDGETVILEGTPSEAPGVQLYILGHGQMIPKGEVARVTGTLDAPGFIRDAKVDLEVEFNDFSREAYGIEGQHPLPWRDFYLDMIHEGSEPVTYRAIVNLGN